jgi:phosphoribosylanthranilate isomerase
MNYPFILKFSSISNLTDARYAAGAWSDFVGFCFDPSSDHYIEPKSAKEIISWINGPVTVAEFGKQPIEWIKDFVEALEIKVIELPSDYTDERVLELGVKLILRGSGDNAPLFDSADLFLVDSMDDYLKLKEKTEKPIMLNVTEKQELGQLDGVSLQGNKELVVGMNSCETWSDILEDYLN